MMILSNSFPIPVPVPVPAFLLSLAYQLVQQHIIIIVIVYSLASTHRNSVFCVIGGNDAAP